MSNSREDAAEVFRDVLREHREAELSEMKYSADEILKAVKKKAPVSREQQICVKRRWTTTWPSIRWRWTLEWHKKR